jgi:hypothetical protein
MTHERIQDLLEDYVDERLDRPTRKDVDQHLKDCPECRSVLDGVAPVDLGALGAPGWDERSMRKAVRRSMLRTARDVVAIVLVGWLTLVMVSALILQPLLINRGGRAQAATVATADLAIMFNPGASVTDWEYNSGILSRTSSVTAVWPVGADLVELGTLESRIGITGFGGVERGPLNPSLLSDQAGPITITDRLATVGEGTVASVALFFDDPLDLAAAQGLIDDGRADVRVVWAGFATPSAGEGRFGPAGLGYTTCGAPAIETGGTGGGGGGGSGFWAPASVEQARAELVRATQNLLDHPEFLDALAFSPFDQGGWQTVYSDLANDAAVSSFVVTGPTTEINRFVEIAHPSAGSILDIDFNNWFAPLCGK